MSKKLVSNPINDATQIDSGPNFDTSKGVRILRALYAIGSYGLSVVTLLYFFAFVNDLFIPVTVNSGPFDTPILTAISINFGLLLLFGLQHSVMARGKFKQWIQRFIDPSIERASYCLATSLVLGFICCSWIPIEGTIWSVENQVAVGLLRSISAAGLAVLLLATFNLDHFELFGLRQAYCQLVQKVMPTMQFKMSGLYKIVRHPIQTGLLMGMWSVPQASTSHLMLAGGMTVYIFIGLYFEEKALIAEFGQTYRDYKAKVAKVIPLIC